MHDNVSSVSSVREPPSAAAATILVVEDERVVADDIKYTLERLGYRVLPIVTSGQEALVSALHARPHVVLVDAELRGPIDGVGTGALLRERLDSPIVYLTTHANEAMIALAERTRPLGYLVKPFSDDDLRTTVEVAIRKQAIASRTQDGEQWFSSTIQSIGDAVIAVDRQDRITFLNAVAETLTTWTAAQAIGKPLTDVFRLADDEGNTAHGFGNDGMRDGFVVSMPSDMLLVARAGTRMLIDDGTMPLLDDGGGALRGLVVFRDVTERRRLERRVASAERLASIGATASGIAHDINEPLTTVSVNLALAKDAAERIESALWSLAGQVPAPTLESLGADVRDLQVAVADADRGGERVIHLAHEIRKLARAGSDTADSRALDLPDVLDAAVRLVGSTLAAEARIEREYTVTPFVEANEAHVTQIFVNLLTNAAQALAEAPGNPQRIVVATRTDRAGRPVVEVRDTGCGIGTVDLARLFPSRGARAAADGAGEGLGLSIVQSLVASLGGDIHVESELGRGTTVRVALIPAIMAARDTSASLSPVAPRRGRILVVDDEQALADGVQRVLRREHDVVVETDPRAALARIATSPPFDLVLCDLEMPGMSGFDVYEALAAANVETSRRVVFWCAGTPAGRTKRMLDAIANPVLPKPFSVISLRAIVRDYITR